MSRPINYLLFLGNKGPREGYIHLTEAVTNAHILRHKILENHPAFLLPQAIDPSDLALYKPTEDLSGSLGRAEAAERVKELEEEGKMQELQGFVQIEDEKVFGKKDLNPGMIHLVVKVQERIVTESLVRTESPVLTISGIYCKRETTVQAIFSKLMKHRFIWVRGTPASGKTVLARLLLEYAAKSLPGANVQYIPYWPSPKSQAALHENYNAVLARFGLVAPLEDKLVLIFDEAQETYDDSGLWNDIFKNVELYDNLYAIGFASYGSASSDLDVGHGTPIIVRQEQRITLQRIDGKDGFPAVGLLFSREEFDDAIFRRFKDEEARRFDQTFLDGLFSLTGGHIGAILDVLRVVMLYRSIKHTSDEQFTWDMFEEHVVPGAFLRQFDINSSIFSRGLPYKHLQNTRISRALSIVVRKTTVKANETTGDNLEILQDCARRGWLHTEDTEETVVYFFASWLHQWYVGWKLFINSQAKGELKVPDEINLLEYVLAVIGRFNPEVLENKNILGPANVHRPPEAQFQDEFYRCSHDHCDGSVVTFPGFGASQSRVDFYVPSKKWAIELVRNSDRLAQHHARFSSGKYHGAFGFSDFVILDFRTTVPQKPHSTIRNLYHIVFQDGYKEVTVLGSTTELVKRFMLTRH